MDNYNKTDWIIAVELLLDWQKGTGHLDELLETRDPGRTRWLVMQVFRDWESINRILENRYQKRPRPQVLNLLRLAVGELLNREQDRYPKIVHHAVQMAKKLGISQGESGFINGVLRTIVREPDKLIKTDPLETHPNWLVNRWINQFGETGAMALINWNQSIPQLTIRADFQPDYTKETEWDGYYQLQPGRFAEAREDLKSGKVYLQDPFSRIPVELLNIRGGENILDLCAAPGGKSRLIANALNGTGKLVAVDKAGPRLMRLEENLRHLEYENIDAVGARVEELDSGQFREAIGEDLFDGVLIDVPCSNTGVMGKRPDVKLRITKDAFKQHQQQQLDLLIAGSKFVRPNGRLVYSTCSIDTEENAAVITAFLKASPGWRLKQSVISYPWECNHDGGGAFLLTLTGSE